MRGIEGKEEKMEGCFFFILILNFLPHLPGEKGEEGGGEKRKKETIQLKKREQ